MAQSTHKFFSKGVDKQKRADISIDLKRVDGKDIAKWTPEQKMEARKFIETAEKCFEVFKQTILSY